MNKEIKRIIIDKGQCSEDDYPFTTKPNFRTLGNIIEMNPPAMIGFVYDDSIRNFQGFQKTTIIKEPNLSDIPVDKIFMRTDIAQGMIFKGKMSGKIHNFTMDVSSGFKYIEIFRGGIQWYMMDTKDFISSFNFKLKNESDDLV